MTGSQWVALGVFGVIILMAGAAASTQPGWDRLSGGLQGWLVRLLPKEERRSWWDRFSAASSRLGAVYLERRNLPQPSADKPGQFLMLVPPLAAALALLLLLLDAPGVYLAALVGPACWEAAGRITRWRHEQLRQQLVAELPPFLERTSIALAGGVDLGRALQLAARGARGPLHRGLQAALQRIEAGYGLERSLAALTEATDPELVTPFVERIIRADRLGQPIGQTLRTLAAEWRRRHREEVEERLNRLPMQLAMVGIVFIFPALVVVVLVPNLLLFWSEGW